MNGSTSAELARVIRSEPDVVVHPVRVVGDDHQNRQADGDRQEGDAEGKPVQRLTRPGLIPAVAVAHVELERVSGVGEQCQGGKESHRGDRAQVDEREARGDLDDHADDLLGRGVLNVGVHCCLLVKV